MSFFFAERDKQRQTINYLLLQQRGPNFFDLYSVRLLVQTLRQHISLEEQGCDKIGHRHGRGPSNGRDMDRRVVQVSQYLGRSLVSKQQATCNQVLCMQPHRGVYRMRPPRYTLLGPKFETNAPAFSRNTVQVPAVLVAAH